MSKREATDISASVRERLKQRFPGFGYDYQVLLVHYALERLLYRLGRSRYRGQFLLKGALLFKLWYQQLVRSSMDADLLGKSPSDVPGVVRVFREVCRLAVEPDGLTFPPDAVRGEEIREGAEYQGVRITMIAMLAGARIPLQIDIGYGDAVTPRAQTVNYPVILDFPAPRVKAYPPYTVIAEKFQTAVDKGLANSRMKDYYDLWYILRHSGIDGVILSAALRATFKRRKTPLPETVPEGLDQGFWSDPAKQRQWASLLKKTSPRETPALSAAIDEIRAFIMPVVTSINDRKPYHLTWRPGHGWHGAEKKEA